MINMKPGRLKEDNICLLRMLTLEIGTHKNFFSTKQAPV